MIETVADAEALTIPPGRPLAYLTQTTCSVTETAAIVAALKRRFPQVRGPNKDDICYATENRQNAVRQCSTEADVALVIGSANSSNTRRLVETAQNAGIPAYRIDGADSIDRNWLGDARSVLVTAGASVPEPLVDEVVDWISTTYRGTVLTHTGEKEQVTFRLPVELRVQPPARVARSGDA